MAGPAIIVYYNPFLRKIVRTDPPGCEDLFKQLGTTSWFHMPQIQNLENGHILEILLEITDDTH